MANGAWLVEWTESERGWGKRPDGCWYYPSEKVAKKQTAALLKEMRDREAKIYKGSTPDEYSYPENPVFVPVSAELAAEIKKHGEVYRHRPEKAAA